MPETYWIYITENITVKDIGQGRDMNRSLKQQE